ncbi:MAG: bifunctional adenosylcobinamide kinase/adenosylcobinamide-phosphate guanylyltransferase [Chloroflexota bacterium]
MTLTLVTGGARSGKSTFAERLAEAGPQPTLYVATARAEDDEMRRRVAEHQSRRPAHWSTLEAPLSVGAALAWAPGPIGTVLLEDLGLLVSNLLWDVTSGNEPGPEASDQLDAAIGDELDDLFEAWADGTWDLIVVTNEVGWGIVPTSPVARLFRDALGKANQYVAGRADSVYLVVAGHPLRVKPAH